MNAVDVVRYGHHFVLESIDGVPVEQWETPGVCGVWSVKDILSHLASFEHVLVEALLSLVEDSPTPTLDRFGADMQRFNDDEVARRQERSARGVWEEYVAAYERTVALIAQVPVERRRALGALPWYGAAYDLEDFLVYSFYGHKREHGAQIAVFRDSLATADAAVRRSREN